ncbi:bifunctional phosphopantothenoylcysteine decarboxylase/phosphopantothenate--cysteine ligase CoaBC [Orrella sp. NBD-18]|uniref:Coenzyme A biosynthesis bifunctional protein CoaBC n=1 Tax=Sheuella amnicola TaxID=2707330 RepID=A0A6B2QUY9_9BURK|nr:bifunctional phosphopantothenoylcysteine decarboxylase/phosphopantothenate--cysteine ligase CoaBC [Sheuella amnicola]NDY81723.1 bifunctional phosphopantothenoylcysteine decarboxylase/phosphopantothenate--cysteine ligase CoaBC [Sheuella amnicola]HBI84397.1 bifunctional phosphopantothenoylcysteine decarboxylase/phosphopantothenate--cysteine ligase CoaBC [Alcaligenaceae bacterium]
MLDLKDKRIVLGMSGGIACYKSAELVRRLIERGATVDVVMTDAATHFITAVTMQALSGRPVFLDQWDPRMPNNMAHIDLSRGADAILIAPASADFLAKLAQGRADDLLSTLCLARACPLLVAPAMNREMWAAAPTQRNIDQLIADGVDVLGPGSGSQACGEIGDGRMLEASELVVELIAFFQQKSLLGKSVLITAGPTCEPIDPIRVITNRSSGKTGYALARAAWEAGAQVTLVSGPTALPAPYGVNRICVETAQQMHDAVMDQIQDQDIFISVAAVADWRVANIATDKLKKDGNNPPSLSFVANPDILATVAAIPNGPWCVGFAAETERLSEYANQKRLRKGIPMLIGNLAQNVMDADHTTVSIFDDQGEHVLATSTKQDVARQLIRAIAERLPSSMQKP